MKYIIIGAASAIVASTVAAAVAQADTDVVYIGGTGTGYNLPILGSGGSGRAFAEVLAPGYDELVNLDYDGSPVANPHWAVPAAVETIAAQDDPVTVLGLSKGAQVARAAEAKDQRPDTKYVYVGDPDDRHGISRTFGLSAPLQAPTHNVEIITDEWDGVGRMPDRPWNLVASANALAGWAFVHPHYGDGTEDDPLTRLDQAKVTVTKNPNGTTTTRKLIPNDELPLLKPLRDTERTWTGDDKATDQLEKHVVKPIVKAGYSEYDKKPKKAEKPATKQDKDSTADKQDTKQESKSETKQDKSSDD